MSRGWLHSLELTLAPEDDAWVRSVWFDLHRAGLNSRHRATSPSNAPHLTVTGSRHLDDTNDELARAIFAPLLPLTVSISGLVTYGSNPFVMAFLPDIPHDLAMAVYEFRSSAVGIAAVRQTWSAHITLALRIKANRLSEAYAALPAGWHGRSVTFTGLRRWDPQERFLYEVAGVVHGPTGQFPLD